jgi:hypothetical protein
MKKIALIIVCIMLTSTVPLTNAAHASISNGGFEEKLSLWTVLTVGGGATVKGEAQTTNPHTGKYCAKVWPTGSNSKIGGLAQKVTGKLTGKVEVSCYSKTDVEAWIEVVPMSGGKPIKVGDFPRSNQLKKTATWTKLTMTFDPNNSADAHEIHLFTRGGASFFDDVTMKASGQTSSNGSFSISPKPELAPDGTKLLFSIVMHIEPFKGGKNPDYNEEKYFRMQAESLKKFCALLDKHRAKLTIQAQSPFTDSCKKWDNPLPELERNGHEIATHFHEDAWVKNTDTKENRKTALAKIKKSVDDLGVRENLTLCGGWQWDDLGEIASSVGFKYVDNYKNPKTQMGLPNNLTVFPYRINDKDVKTSDPKGKILYVTEGVWVDQRKIASVPPNPTPEDFDGITKMFNASFPTLVLGKVCTANFVMHLSDFTPSNIDKTFALYDEYLTRIVDPLVKTGLIQYSTISESGKLFEQTIEQGQKPLPQLIIVMNQNYQESEADAKTTVANLRFQQALCEKYNAFTEHYFTGLAWEQTLKYDSNYLAFVNSKGVHIHTHGANRDPKPFLVSRMKGVSWEEDFKTALEYESHGLDPVTGKVLTTPGGIDKVQKQAMTLIPSCGRTIHAAILAADKSLGFKIGVGFGENSGTPSNRTFLMNVLGRPDDIFIHPNNMFLPWVSGRFDLKKQILNEIRLQNYTEPRFIMFVVHDNDMFKGKDEKTRKNLWTKYEEVLKWLVKDLGIQPTTIEKMYKKTVLDSTVTLTQAKLAAKNLIAGKKLTMGIKSWPRELSMVELLQVALSEKETILKDVIGPTTIFEGEKEVSLTQSQAKDFLSKASSNLSSWKSVPAKFEGSGITISAGQLLYLACQNITGGIKGNITIPSISNYPVGTEKLSNRFDRLQMWTCKRAYFTYTGK